MQTQQARRTVTTLCTSTMNAFRDILPWDGACIYLVNDDGAAFGHHLFQMQSAQLSLYQKRLASHDPLSPGRFAKSRTSVVTLESAQRDFDSTLYIDTFLNAFNLPYEVELFFRDDTDRIVAGLGLFRAADSGRFRMSEVDLLRRVRPLAECGFRTIVDKPMHENEQLSGSYNLTRREVEVIRHVRRGSSNREIGDALGIGIATVKAHLFNAYEKVGVSSRTELLYRLFIDTD